MEEADYLKSRFRELANRCISDSYLTHSEFLSMSEQGIFYEMLKEEHVSYLEKKYHGVSYFFYGGHEEDDRKILYFIPSYLTKEEALEEESLGATFSCLHISPRNPKFADTLTHRDYLGALMHLGVRREMYGDILTDGTEGYVFVMNTVKDSIQNELGKIRHTSVKVEEILPKDCPFEMRFELEDINVSSNRLDCILAEVYHLSRRDAQVLIADACIFIDGMTCMDNSHTLKENDRVSVKGKGKFIFLGEGKLSRKNRLFCKIKRYC